ncbi:MAG: alpha/beta hydrolase [Acidobacteriota bacterium]|nr:alpha/beta hydrolase [Acidobacteriota bacterium]
MNGGTMRKGLWTFVLLVTMALPSLGQTPAGAADWANEIETHVRVVPNVTYLTADGYESKLDLYLPRQGDDPTPTLVYIHGGGWVGGTKESNVMRLMPYLQMGWAVVNVEYRLGRVALAPGAVEDCRCALRWIRNNAAEYNIDTSKIVVTGHSAGGHLSLTTGMLTAAAGFDNRCPKRSPTSADAMVEEMPVAAIVNWYGITDVPDLVSGPNAKTYAVAWMGSLPNKDTLGKQLSPLNMVRGDLPPILTIHGDADPIVPYAHATQLQAKLTQAGVAHRLHTVPGGGHGGFSSKEMSQAYQVIRAFLAKHVTGSS